MAFLFFTLAAILATVVLMPLNYFKHGSTDSEPDLPDSDNSTLIAFFTSEVNHTLPLPASPSVPTVPPASMYDLLLNPSTSTAIHLLFTYLFSILLIGYLHRTYHNFIQARQSFSLHLIHSIAARTVIVTHLPPHLRGDQALAEYFEGCGWSVESVSVCREVEKLRQVLSKRTDALKKLEEAWAEWVGNPSKLGLGRGYDPEVYAKGGTGGRDPAIVASPPATPAGENDHQDLEQHPSNARSQSTSSQIGADAWADAPHVHDPNAEDDHHHVPASSDYLHPSSASRLTGENGHVESAEKYTGWQIRTNRARPLYRPRLFGAQVDAIDYWEKQFQEADSAVRQLRRGGRWEASHVAFVTFEDVKAAVCLLRSAWWRNGRLTGI